jgi:cell division protein FtsB
MRAAGFFLTILGGLAATGELRQIAFPTARWFFNTSRQVPWLHSGRDGALFPWFGWLGALLLVVQADLWFGKGNLPYVMSLHEQLAEQRAANAQLRERNSRVAAEVGDLRDGLEMVEEKARSELGMVRPDEIFVQLNPARPAAPR